MLNQVQHDSFFYQILQNFSKVNLSDSENQKRVVVLSLLVTKGCNFGGNMSYQNAYTAYQRNNVNTASQGRLVVLLYEGAIKHLNGALSLMEEDDKIKACNIEQFGIHLQKTQAIITELQVSLDMEKGGDISKNLMSLYMYFNEELMDAAINHKKTKIQFVLKMLTELADSWRMVANSTANAPAAKVANALNIVG